MPRKALPELERLARRLARKHGQGRDRERFAELLFRTFLRLCPYVCHPGYTREDVCIIATTRFVAKNLQHYRPWRGSVVPYAYGVLCRVRKELWRKGRRTP